MNKNQLTALCFVVTAFSVSVSNAVAQQTRNSGHNSLPPLMKILDLDKNGVLSSAEIAMAIKSTKETRHEWRREVGDSRGNANATKVKSAAFELFDEEG